MCTPLKQALEVLDAVENVMPIDASNIHIDYGSLLEKWYKQPVAGTIQKNHIFSFEKQTIKNCIMTTKRSYNAAVTSTQSIKRRDKYPNDTLRKLDILYSQMKFLAKPGLKPIKQVHLYTKWRSVVPHPYKDITCPLPSNEIIQMVLKRKPKKKTKQTTGAATTTTATTTVGTAITNAAVTTTTPATRTPRSTRKLKEHETRTIEVEGKPVDVHPDEVGSSDEGSEYVDSLFDPLEQLEQQLEPRQTRGKQFLPPKPAAVLNKERKKERDKHLAENKQDIKEKKKEITKRRINTRNQKRLEREKKEPPAKRLRSRKNYYNKHNTTIV